MLSLELKRRLPPVRQGKATYFDGRSHVKRMFWLAAVICAIGVACLGPQSPPPATIAAAAGAASQPVPGSLRWFDAVSTSAPDGTDAADAPADWIARSGRAVSLHGQTVAQYLSQWEGAARMAEPRAAYHVYQALAICATSQGDTPALQDAAQRAQFEQERKAVLQICASVSPALVQERLHFLGIAAQAGLREAQIDFYMEGPNGKTVNWSQARTDPAVQQWQADALHFLQQAGAHGEPFAYGLLANAYYAGTLAPRDAKLALTYAAAEAQLRHHELTPAQVQRRYRGLLSTEEVAYALSQGKDLVQGCCD